MAKFKKTETGVNGLYIIEPTVFGDNRGFFMESWNKRDYEKIGINLEFVQDNHSKSGKGVLRGIHFQERHQQAKLVRCIKGKVLDIAVDLREGSETFGQYYKILLTEENKKQFFIPKGFGHAFLALVDNTEFLYKADDYYCPNCESGIRYDDQTINIDWELKKHEIDSLVVSEKDNNLLSFENWIINRRE